jgi:hypothetical protein
MTLHNKNGDAIDITVRLAKPCEAPRLIELLIKQHGYNYPNSNLYDEDFMYHGLENKTLYFIVPELTDGTIVGMVGASVENTFKGSIPFILLVVEMSLRGFEIGKILHRSLIDAAFWDAYTCIYGHCLTLDTISQSNHIAFGYKMTGFIFNRYIYDTMAENLSGLPLPLKRSHLVACFPKAKQDAGTLYLPSSYANFITDIYRSLGVAYTLKDVKDGIVEKTQYDFEQKDKHRYGELLVTKTGNDFTDILSDILTRYMTLENQSFNAFVNLNDPGCPAACAILEKKGFFFTGLQPLAGEYEYMIMHYSPAIPVPFEKIAVVPEFQKQFIAIQYLYKERKHG